MLGVGYGVVGDGVRVFEGTFWGGVVFSREEEWCEVVMVFAKWSLELRQGSKSGEACWIADVKYFSY